MTTQAVKSIIDEPLCLRDPAQCDLRRSKLGTRRMWRLKKFVASLRKSIGNDDIPDFDPLDGGVHAECLFLLETPGKQAVRTGFISRNTTVRLTTHGRAATDCSSISYDCFSLAAI